MPRINGTGPEGAGPMTGRRMGRCTNYGANLNNNKETEPEKQTGEQKENIPGGFFGFGGGRGRRGRGRGFQNRFRGGF